MLILAGSFGGNVGQDPHLLNTLSAIQIFALFDKMDVLDIEKVSDYILRYVVNRNVLHVFRNLLLVSGIRSAFWFNMLHMSILI